MQSQIALTTDELAHLNSPPGAGPLRRLYCELWCAMFAGEHDAIAEAAGALGGERAGRILPAVLTMQARTKEQRCAEVDNCMRTEIGGHVAVLYAPFLRETRQAVAYRQPVCMCGAEVRRPRRML